MVQALDKIENNPLHYFSYDKKLRRINLANFPYKFIYTVKELTKEIIVLGLFHHFINPKEIGRRSI
jgi:hypothetical protein